MNLEEFRKALSSDATEENAQLKRQLSDLQTEYHEKLSKLENENDSLKESCRVLCNRCFTLTRGVTCLFCGLYYPCPHMPRLEAYIIEMICDWWAFSWIKGDLSEMFAWYKDHESYIKLHNNTRSIVEEILEMIRTKLTEVENAEN